MSDFYYAVRSIAEIVCYLGFFSMVVLSVYFLTRARIKERLALIEKGIDLSATKKKSDIFLKIAFVFIGLSIGIFLGYVIQVYTKIPKEVSYSSMILFFGGLALLIYYLVFSKRTND